MFGYPETSMQEQLTVVIEELALSGICGVGHLCKSSAYRWLKALRERLDLEKDGWIVKMNYDPTSRIATFRRVIKEEDQ